MKLTPPPALSRLAARFQERRARAAAGERPPMTADDEDNIRAFTRMVISLKEMLDEENAALRNRDPAGVAALFPAKQDLLKQLETRQSVVEPFLRESAAATAELRGHIQTLSATLELNAGLLQVMSDASAGIRAEVARVRERHSLKGMYDKSGQEIDPGLSRRKSIDTNY